MASVPVLSHQLKVLTNDVIRSIVALPVIPDFGGGMNPITSYYIARDRSEQLRREAAAHRMAATHRTRTRRAGRIRTWAGYRLIGLGERLLLSRPLAGAPR